MNVLGSDDIARRVGDWSLLIDAADRALQALATGRCEAPIRSSLSLPDGQLLTMPGRLHDADDAIVKLVAVMPGNAARGLATIQGVAFVIDARSGRPLAQLDGSSLTAVRTAAISAAGARRLAGHPIRIMALLGAGAQAPWQARALCSALPVERLVIWSPTPEHRERLARQLSEELRAEVRAVDRPEEAAREAQLICCATSAPRAFLHADMLAPHPVLVVAIGAFRPDMAEVGASVFAVAGKAYVDDVDAVLQEGGDVLAAINARVLEPAQVLAVGEVSQPPTERVRVFKSVGSAVEDAAVAAALLRTTPDPALPYG